MITAFEKYAREILAGKIEMAYTEDHVKDKTYRTKLVVDLDQNVVGPNGKPAIRGIMGLRTDVTDIMKIGKLEGENIRLAAEEQAAKASNELKSKFLANVSTLSPIAVSLNYRPAFCRGLLQISLDEFSITPLKLS